MQLFKFAFFAVAASATALEQLNVDWEITQFIAEGSTTSFHVKGTNFETNCKAEKRTKHNNLAVISNAKCADSSVRFSLFPLHNEAESWTFSVSYNDVAAKAIASSTSRPHSQKLDLPKKFKLTKNRP